MSIYLALKFAHLIAFVYWLGGDLGTYLASRQVVREDLGNEARGTALHIMLACDMGPKLAMPLILALGAQLATSAGMLALPIAAMLGLWLAVILWFAMVLTIYLREGTPAAKYIAEVDFWFRITVVVALFAVGGAILVGALQASGAWLGWKILVFAAMVFCGLMIRVNLRPFGAAFGNLLAGKDVEAANATLRRTIGRCRPWVWCIWAGLFLNAAFGMHLL
ncbi:hypothetical protein [Haliea sp. E17]|uniref:hypothetical protein n=1 Tax=Haliea sp. E17 TaxID=3401576 RepID=UPI003AAFF30B